MLEIISTLPDGSHEHKTYKTKKKKLLLCHHYSTNGKKHGTQTTYHQNGDVKKIGVWRNGIKTGTFIEFYIRRTGEQKVSLIETFDARGRLDGVRTKYYLNGKHSSKLSYKNGQLHGKHATYRESGRVHITCNWTNDCRHGTEKRFNLDGLIERKTKYKNGILHGLWSEFSETGSLVTTLQYVKGRVHGTVRSWAKGKLIKEDIYRNGLRIKSFTYANNY